MSDERRIFERENVRIPFIYSLDEGASFNEGEWKEAVTVDIGPVLVGGLAFYTEDDVAIDDPIRIALFMDLSLKKVWQEESDEFPAIYHGNICRIEKDETGKKAAVIFRGFEKQFNETPE
ncbi:MAG: hypothetical protein AB1656_23405 [Candidatus Omnitrophota bacterium]